MNVTVRNVITSMRMISAVDWAEFFESVSLVDAALRADSDFAEMDFPTRDRYRHAIEELARGSGQPELEVARHAIAAAKRAASEPPSGGSETPRPEQEPGYYLISKGRRAHREGDWIPCSGERMAGTGQRGRGNPRLCRRDRDHRRAHSGPGLVGRGGVRRQRMDALRAGAARRGYQRRMPRWRWSTAASQPPSEPELCRRWSLRNGVPASLRTIVVVPTLLTTRAEIEEQIERLEVHYLASQDGDLRFALLSDWTDSTTQNAPDDDELLGAAAAGIARLNQRHGSAPEGAAFLPAPSPADLERGAGQVDRMGTQARKAARAESLAARRDRHHLRGD